MLSLKVQLQTCNPCWLTCTRPWTRPSQRGVFRGLLQGHWANHSLTNKLSPADVILPFLLRRDSAPFRSRSRPMRDIWGPVTGRQMLGCTDQGPHLAENKEFLSEWNDEIWMTEHLWLHIRDTEDLLTFTTCCVHALRNEASDYFQLLLGSLDPAPFWIFFFTNQLFYQQNSIRKTDE